MAPKNKHFSIWLDGDTRKRMKAYGERWHVSAQRIAQRLLGLIPWDKDDQTQFVVSVPSTWTKHPDKLRMAFSEAVEAVIKATQDQPPRIIS